ncbi:MAG: alpha/beta fold hydrolase [Rhodospirillales bacterium]|nr:MAG: alpha/beta fold hydrolase [Rhodospirillales bacterium]
MKRLLTVMMASLLVHGCVSGAADDADGGVGQLVEVGYATDRPRQGTDGRNLGFLAGRGTLQFGTALISIPAGHVAGRLEAPAFDSNTQSGDPRHHIVLNSVQPLEGDAFVADLRAALDRSRRNEILVFVHGYNTDFDLALRRTGQLRVDLDFAGVTVAFSWPSASRAALYVADQNNADWAAPDLAETLGLLVAESGAERIHVLVHSMGGRILLRAFEELARDGAGRELPVFGEVIFAAPDVDADIFARTARRLLPLARRFTLYASDSDMAMAAARSAAGGYPRAGDSKSGIVVLPGMDTVDASAVRDDLFGHEYFGESTPVLDDMRILLRDGTGAAMRPRMQRDSHRGSVFWRLLPPAGS